MKKPEGISIKECLKAGLLDLELDNGLTIEEDMELRAEIIAREQNSEDELMKYFI